MENRFGTWTNNDAALGTTLNERVEMPGNELILEHNAHISDNTTHPRFGTTTGTANAYVLTLSPAPTLVTGLNIMAKINIANTGASTINVNSLGTKAIVDVNGLALTSGALKLDMVYNLVYNGTSFVVEGYEALKSTVDAHGTRLDLQERVLTTTIPTTGWSGTAPYSVAVNVPGLTDSRPDINPIYSATVATALLQKESWNKISYIDCTANTMTVYCLEEIPTTAINIELVGA